jgi:hypothetical protein
MGGKERQRTDGFGTGNLDVQYPFDMTGTQLKEGFLDRMAMA